MLLWGRTKKHKEINVVLSASGVRAPCFIGALQAIQEKGYTVRRIAGSSGGAIVAAGYALGMDLDKLKEIALSAPYSEFQDFHLKNLCSLTNPSVYSGKGLDKFYREVFGDTTLKDFQIDCRIVVVTILGREKIVLGRDNYPDLPVWKAVRMSSSIPFIFPYLELDGTAVTDGALLTNMFDIFPKEDCQLVTLGPRADYSIKKAGQIIKYRHLFLWNYLKILIEYFLDAVDNRHIPQDEWGKTITIPTFEIGGFDFDLNPQDIERLMQYGYNAVIVSDLL